MKRNIRIIIRKLISCRENESILDAVHRIMLTIKKNMNIGSIINNDSLVVGLKEIGLCNGDNIMLHSSWRAFYNYTGTPCMVIDDIINLIGDCGTLVMPCYGNSQFSFDIDNDKSEAGVISEVFRVNYNVMRSKCCHFSCAAVGKNAKYITDTHNKSIYGFDKWSPYSKFSQLNNSKIVMLGLGKKSAKLSLYHLPEMILINKSEFYKKLMRKKYVGVIKYNEGNKVIIARKKMIDRLPTVPNKKNIKKIYLQDFVACNKVGNIDIVVIDAKRALNFILKEAEKGNYMVKVR